ncbi:pyridoxal phosphate-dependent transferase [Thermoascus aurantiacus ATCC 26904]
MLGQKSSQSLDAADALKSFRDKFIIPSKANLKTKKLAKPGLSAESCIYFCGNSLGLQPKATAKYLEAHLDTWSSIGVRGHFTDLEDSPLNQMSRLVGASPEEVTAMGTLTMNLHFLLASFYKPTKARYKIVLDWKAFPSDHFAIESQISWHGLDPRTSMVFIGPDEGEYTISTSKILSVINEHTAETALLLLPGIQYYSGRLFDIPTITKHAHLHDWNVDFAAWCTYKYGNAGLGAISGLFVHERHGIVDYSQGGNAPVYRHRLTGWYGSDRAERFKMDNNFKPIPGAKGFPISNPSAVDLASLCAALSVFEETTMGEIRAKSVLLTAYLEHLLLDGTTEESRQFRIITPSDPQARGAQLSLLLKPGLRHNVAQKLQETGIVCDKREPDVIRVAPAPLYNTFAEVREFVQHFKAALAE